MKKVIIFTTKTCPHCRTAKAFLQEKGISFEEKDINEDAEARKELMKRGVRGVPAFLIGEELVLGLDTEKIENLIDYLVVDCAKCKTRLRVPKNKGKLTVTCPKCATEFKMTT